MELVALDLPEPTRLRGRWAAWAAVHAAMGRSDECRADGSVWHYDDGGGNWVDLHRLGGGRAVLVGNDHECSPEPDEFPDLVPEVPDWWRPPLRDAVRENENVAIVYGFDGTVWRRVDYGMDDGFSAVNLLALTRERTRRRILDACGYDSSGCHDPTLPRPSDESIDALIAADGDITEELVAAVVGTEGRAPAVGAAHARRFLTA
ncbi:proteophosphoglycan 5 [Streptomyces sp. TRM43335]|uniref:Proteophosphoglycan 5 n=1 Tax=Streptomyces taklimakanensis TaxID=2569853 RepID=A0A6G2BJZ8_9ACTN|nr:proteophosphoglycan 5 [Streptomyces taklimakanensis]MTE22383.1 proteophosphoglycan 5 [Streptomyces taklimakanensis]